MVYILFQYCQVNFTILVTLLLVISLSNSTPPPCTYTCLKFLNLSSSSLSFFLPSFLLSHNLLLLTSTTDGFYVVGLQGFMEHHDTSQLALQ